MEKDLFLKMGAGNVFQYLETLNLPGLGDRQTVCIRTDTSIRGATIANGWPKSAAAIAV